MMWTLVTIPNGDVMDYDAEFWRMMPGHFQTEYVPPVVVNETMDLALNITQGWDAGLRVTQAMDLAQNITQTVGFTVRTF